MSYLLLRTIGSKYSDSILIWRSKRDVEGELSNRFESVVSALGRQQQFKSFIFVHKLYNMSPTLSSDGIISQSIHSDSLTSLRWIYTMVWMNIWSVHFAWRSRVAWNDFVNDSRPKTDVWFDPYIMNTTTLTIQQILILIIDPFRPNNTNLSKCYNFRYLASVSIKTSDQLGYKALSHDSNNTNIKINKICLCCILPIIELIHKNFTQRKRRKKPDRG